MYELLKNIEIGRRLSDPDPVRRAQIQMKAPLPKRFYKKISVETTDGKYGVFLDERLVYTPAQRMLLFPVEAAARIVADEFARQKKVIDIAQMPATRLANSAIDGVAGNPQDVTEDIMRFVACDMLCYRAKAPDRLVKRQAESWDPLIDWVHSVLGIRFTLAEGVMHIDQPSEVLIAFHMHVATVREPIALAALHAMTTLTGSAILALAIAHGEMSVSDGWMLAHLDENWIIEHWGEDSEAMARRVYRQAEMIAAAALFSTTNAY